MSAPVLKPHHAKSEFCYSRAAYREGRQPKAVKVYTINQESRYLLAQGVPALGAHQELIKVFALYGPITEYRLLDDYPTEEFTEVIWIKFQKIQSARVAKRKVDNYNFFGGVLHVCYAPEYETVDETREKLQERRVSVAKRLRLLASEQELGLSYKESDTEVAARGTSQVGKGTAEHSQEPPGGLNTARLSRVVAGAESSVEGPQYDNKPSPYNITPSLPPPPQVLPPWSRPPWQESQSWGGARVPPSHSVPPQELGSGESGLILRPRGLMPPPNLIPPWMSSGPMSHPRHSHHLQHPRHPQHHPRGRPFSPQQRNPQPRSSHQLPAQSHPAPHTGHRQEGPSFRGQPPFVHQTPQDPKSLHERKTGPSATVASSSSLSSRVNGGLQPGVSESVPQDGPQQHTSPLIVRDYKVKKGTTPKFVPRQLAKSTTSVQTIKAAVKDAVNEELKRNAFILRSTQGPSLPSKEERKRKTFKETETGDTSLDQTVRGIRSKVKEFSAKLPEPTVKKAKKS